MKLYVGNLPWRIKDSDLKELFVEFNPSEAKVITDKFSGRSKGFGFVTVDDDSSAQEALSQMNGKEVDGRALTVNEARPMRDERASSGQDNVSEEAPMADPEAVNESTEDSIEDDQEAADEESAEDSEESKE